MKILPLTLRSVTSSSLALILLAMLAACQPTISNKSLSSTISMDSKRYASEPHRVDILDRNAFASHLQPAYVANTTGLPPGSILVDTGTKQLYYVETEQQARRYGVAVGASGKAWKGTAQVGRKSPWPAWYPTDDMKTTAPGIPSRIPPGADNPLGARALYLYKNGSDTLYRIHGTSEPLALGTEVSSGCIRMLNEDIIDLYDHVRVGAKVVVR